MDYKDFTAAKSWCWMCQKNGIVYFYGRHYYCPECWEIRRKDCDGIFDDYKIAPNNYYHNGMRETLKNDKS